MKKFTLFILIISVCESCSDRNYRGKTPKYSSDCTLDGRTYTVVLIDKNKPDSCDYFINESDFSAFGNPLINPRVTLCFRNGTISSSWVSDKKFEACLSAINTSHGKLIAFSTNCLSDMHGVTAVWSGIVKGNRTHGTFSWLLPNGKMVSYSFWGTEIKNSGDDKKAVTISLVK